MSKSDGFERLGEDTQLVIAKISNVLGVIAKVFNATVLIVLGDHDPIISVTILGVWGLVSHYSV